MCKAACHPGNHKTRQEQNVRNQIVTDDHGPSSLVKELGGVQASIRQIVPIQTDVGQRKGVESVRQIVDARGQTGLNAIDAFMKTK